jgi:hypothetical protein
MKHGLCSKQGRVDFTEEDAMPKIRSSFSSRWLPGARALGAGVTLVALAGCMDSSMPTGPVPTQPVGPVVAGELNAAITGDVTLTFEGGGIVSIGDQGFRLRSPGTGSTTGQLMEFREFDRFDIVEPGTYPIVEAWSYFHPGFTVTWSRPVVGGRQNYAAVEGTLHVTEVTPSAVIGSFHFHGAQTYECVEVQGAMECDPVSGDDRRRIEASGEFVAVR